MDREHGKQTPHRESLPSTNPLAGTEWFLWSGQMLPWA